MLSESTTVVDRSRSASISSSISNSSNDQKVVLRDKQLSRAERRPGHQRRYAPKTRTGCITCKIRRVKCDEDKPHCKRCTTTGRKCDGYAQLGDSPTRPRSPEPLTVALVNDVSSDALERRTFDFFRARTAPCVSGYFADAVWDRLVLQLSHQEPAVRHAINALGALHEERSLRRTAGAEGIDVSLVKTGFPILQYSKALNEMQELLKSGKAPLDVILLCSLLCIHFEALRESFVPALMHVENAIQLLQSNTTFDARKVNPSLVRAVMRMDLQGTLYLGSRVPGMPFFTAATDSILPSSFHDLTHARDLVNTWTSRLFHFMRTTGDHHRFRFPGDFTIDALAQAQELEQTFVKLDSLLWDFMHKPTAKLSIREQHGLGMLRTRTKMNRILAASSLYSEASYFDQFIDEFENILGICMYIMGSDNADRRLFSVSLDEGLIQPLFFVATHCRDGKIRHQALDHLRKLPVRDGIWHVETTSRTAEMCVRFEEALCDKQPGAALCSDIPEWRRVHSASFDAMGDEPAPKKKVMVKLRSRPNGLDGEWVDTEEHIDWLVPSQYKNLRQNVELIVRNAAVPSQATRQ
ncbi:Putative zn(2)-C6 fungal-type DNA-binding domain, fungal transcription factor [Septoria linicola]|uniref:Zn(2)-C6 fungal-type DNA-binding domain, fungal transcription factor n=1 Tax=Septoria linicola TaxID=215465 RepID=A0A9Q9AKF9_9PEZI|nr:putative zn(2)-C6 fungal-type DNA-binding domain, fungal transcription factor [Septoria linicola]USW47788.1 Putative zn(2)-C6 fungal-type DNA-binding domain, fungal transcription factor [Septoria linicola]